MLPDFLSAGVLVALVGLLPSMSLTVRRLHDTDRSGLWVPLWCVTPLPGWVVTAAAIFQSLGDALTGGDLPSVPALLSLGVALLVTATVVVWAIRWLNQEDYAGPNRCRPVSPISRLSASTGC